jgi:hypothetical protein
MFGDDFEQATDLPYRKLTRIIVRSSWAARESILVELARDLHVAPKDG